MRDITPRKPSKEAPRADSNAKGKPDIVPPPPAFTYDPLSSAKPLRHSIEAHDAPRHQGDPGDKPLPRGGSTVSRANNPKPKKKWWKWVLGFILLGGLLTLAFLSFQVNKISTNPFSWGKLKGEADGRINILLLGVGDPGHAGAGLSDTNMVVSLNTKSNKVAMISIPRDTRVKIPGYGYQKINNAHAEGDIPLAIKTVEQNLDIPIHYYVRANFTGLKQAVDAVGGIDINVTDRLYDPEYPCDKNENRSCGFKLNPGQTHMDGSLALKYARCRKGSCGDDFGRSLRQQQVLQAIRAKAVSLQTLSNPGKLNALLGSAANNIKTDLSINNMMRLSDLSKKFDMTNIINVVFSLKPNGFLKGDPSGSSDLLPVGGSFESIQNFVANVFTLGPVWKEEPTVIIQNGTASSGVAKKLSDKIASGDYSELIIISALTNAAMRDHTLSQIIDYTAGTKPATAAYLQSLVGVAPKVPETTTAPGAAKPTTKVTGPANFVIILGTDYIAKTTSTPPTKK